jgi:hypothetical protein
MIPALMIAFAVLDLSFVGFRSAAGRDGRIDKREYYARAMLRGAAAGMILSAVLGLVTWIVMSQMAQPYALFAEMVDIGRTMSIIFGAYAFLVVAALLVYGVSRHEIRTLSTVAILGPFTLIRPWIVVLALAAGLGPTRTLPAMALTALSCIAVLGTGMAIDAYYASRQNESTLTKTASREIG